MWREQGIRVISELHRQRGLQLLELRVFVVFLRPPTTRCCCCCVSVGGGNGVSRKRGRTVFDGAGSCWYVDRDVFGAHEALVELFLLEVVEFLQKCVLREGVSLAAVRRQRRSSRRRRRSRSCPSRSRSGSPSASRSPVRVCP